MKGAGALAGDEDMKEKLRIFGSERLEGEVTVSGGKNAAVAIIPAALLADSPSTIENIPDINDVHVIIEMLKYIFEHEKINADSIVARSLYNSFTFPAIHFMFRFLLKV